MMSDLPLQPMLTPWLPWHRRMVIILGLSLVVILLGLLSPARVLPPRLLISDGKPGATNYMTESLRALSAARQRITVVMYVIRYDAEGPVAALLQALADAAARGVTVRVVMDQGRDYKTNEPDDKHVEAAAWLRAHGVSVLLDELDRTTHAKAIIVDGRTTVIGSHNWTRYALTQNREWSVVLDDLRFAEELEAQCAVIPGWNSALRP
jgi:phosphatidylserine/phosphatidylglycerophosphate/cardiolipin synthase-like enzyme